MNTRYTEQSGTVTADDGTELVLTVQLVDIDTVRAHELFEQGVEQGDWGWKHKVWTVNTQAELDEVQAAARFFYGWTSNSERISKHPTGYTGKTIIRYEAWYAC